MTKQRYVIVDSRQTVGNSVLFWANDSVGYTCDLRMAAILTEDEMKEFIKNKRTSDKLFLYADALKLVQHHVDIQDLYRNPMPELPHTFSKLKVNYDS